MITKSEAKFLKIYGKEPTDRELKQFLDREGFIGPKALSGKDIQNMRRKYPATGDTWHSEHGYKGVKDL